MRKTFITTSLIAAIVAMPAFADPTAQELLDQKTVTSKYYVDTTKQDKITTDKVLFAGDGTGEDDIYVPAIVATNDAGTALNGNTVGILSEGLIDYMGTTFAEYNSNDYADGSMDNFVPTVAAVATEITATNGWVQSVSDDLATKQNKMSCAGYVPGHEGDINYCWLYGEVEVMCKNGGESCEYNGECCGTDTNGTCLNNVCVFTGSKI